MTRRHDHDQTPPRKQFTTGTNTTIKHKGETDPNTPSFGTRSLAEASPFDPEWGSRLRADDPERGPRPLSMAWGGKMREPSDNIQ